jgi:hypothetical protein
MSMPIFSPYFGVPIVVMLLYPAVVMRLPMFKKNKTAQ